jgi:hypothetical protein
MLQDHPRRGYRPRRELLRRTGDPLDRRVGAAGRRTDPPRERGAIERDRVCGARRADVCGRRVVPLREMLPARLRVPVERRMLGARERCPTEERCGPNRGRRNVCDRLPLRIDPRRGAVLRRAPAELRVGRRMVVLGRRTDVLGRRCTPLDCERRVPTVGRRVVTPGRRVVTPGRALRAPYVGRRIVVPGRTLRSDDRVAVRGRR